MTPSRNRTVAEQINARFETLTRSERKLASALLDSYPVLGLGTITSVAEAAEVSTPTVARMAKKLGFGGFPEMKEQLRTELEETISNPIAKHDRWAEHAPDAHILNRFTEAVMDNIRQTLKQIKPETFDTAVSLLADRNRTVHVLGGRITRALADYFFTHMQVVRGGLVQVAANSNTWPHYVLDMKEGDILVLFDIRRYEHDLERLAEMARKRGVRIILFTDQWSSPVAKHAAHAFHCRIEAPSAWDSNVAILLTVEAMLAAVQTARWGDTRARMKDLEALFDETKLFRKFL